MGLQKQAKTLSKIQIKLVGDYLTTTRNPYRNTLMFHSICLCRFTCS